jgi:hypothetical protein
MVIPVFQLPQHQLQRTPSRGWENLASEYDLDDMMDLENEADHVLPTVEEEFVTYTTALLSLKSMNIVRFWEVSNCNVFNYVVLSAIIIYRCKRWDCQHCMQSH